MSEKLEFIGYTVGLDCNGHGKFGKLLKVEFSRYPSGDVLLTAVSGHNLSAWANRKTITPEQFENRPSKKIDEARWALKHLGFSLVSDDFEDERARRIALGD